jgi:hypothetical protein
MLEKVRDKIGYNHFASSLSESNEEEEKATDQSVLIKPINLFLPIYEQSNLTKNPWEKKLDLELSNPDQEDESNSGEYFRISRQPYSEPKIVRETEENTIFQLLFIADFIVLLVVAVMRDLVLFGITFGLALVWWICFLIIRTRAERRSQKIRQDRNNVVLRGVVHHLQQGHQIYKSGKQYMIHYLIKLDGIEHLCSFDWPEEVCLSVPVMEFAYSQKYPNHCAFMKDLPLEVDFPCQKDAAKEKKSDKSKQ